MPEENKYLNNVKVTVTDKNRSWIELCEYVKREILGYDENMKFPTYLAQRLQGIKRGEYIANKNHDEQANYDDFVLLCTFKYCKPMILNYYRRNEKKIKDERHRMNIALKIAEDHLNDIYLRVKKARESKEKVENNIVENQNYDNAAEYKKKTTEVNNKMKGLF